MATQLTTPAPRELFPPEESTGPRFSWIGQVAQDVRELYQYRAVLLNLVSQDLRTRYHRSLLGFFWTLLNPILMMIVLSTVFTQLLRFEGSGADYALYLFAGMLPWALLFSTTNECSTCVIANEILIRKIYIPKLIFPVSRLVLNATMLVLSMSALFIMMLPLQARLTPHLVLVPVAIVLFAAFSLGIGLIVAIVNTYYRDFGHLISVIMQAWYFATPIIYKLSLMPEEIQWRFWMNPVYPFIRLFQVLISEQQWPEPVLLLTAAGIAATTLGIGYVTFKTYEDKLVFRL